MPLEKCPDCGNSVSTKAKACPKCGRSINKDNFLVGVVFYLVLIAFGFLFGRLSMSFAPIVGGTIIFVGGFFFLAHLLRKLIIEIK